MGWLEDLLLSPFIIFFFVVAVSLCCVIGSTALAHLIKFFPHLYLSFHFVVAIITLLTVPYASIDAWVDGIMEKCM